MGPSIDAPTGLIGMQHAGCADLLFDLFVIGFEPGGQMGPGLGQSAGADLKRVADRQQVRDVAHAHAEQIMQPGAVDQHIQTQGGAGQGIGHRWGDHLTAVTTPVAVHSMLMNLRRNRWEVFDDAAVLTAGFTQPLTAIRAVIQGMVIGRVDMIRGGTTGSGMAFLLPWLPVLFAVGGLLVRGGHARRRGGRRRITGVLALGLRLLPQPRLARQLLDLFHRLFLRQGQQRQRFLARHAIGSPSSKRSRQRRWSG